MTRDEVEKRLESKEEIEKYAPPILEMMENNELNQIEDTLQKMEVGFGKYQGQTLWEIAEADQKYFEWLVCPDEVLRWRRATE